MGKRAPVATQTVTRRIGRALGPAGSIGAAAGGVLAVRFLGVGAGLAFGVVVSRMFGASLTGVLAVGITVVLAGKTLGELGVATPMLRFSAAAADAAKWGAVAGIYRRGVVLATTSSLVVAAALIAAAPTLATRVFSQPELSTVLRILGIGIVPAVLLVVHVGMLRGLHRPVAAAIFESIGPYAVAIPVLLVFGNRFGVAGAAWALMAGSTVMLFAARFSWRRLPRPAAPAEPIATGTLLAAGLPVLVIMGAHLAIDWSDTIMLGILASSSDVGVYSVANRTALLVSFVLHATNAVTAPHYAAMYARGDVGSMRKLAATSTLMMSAIALPVAAGLVVGSHRVLGVFGAEFVAGSAALAILAGAQLVNVAAGSVGTILTMTGHERPLRNVMVVGGVANVALNAMLIPFWGPEGAAVATAISLVGVNAAGLALVRRRLGFSTLPRLGEKHA